MTNQYATLPMTEDELTAVARTAIASLIACGDPVSTDALAGEIAVRVRAPVRCRLEGSGVRVFALGISVLVIP